MLTRRRRAPQGGYISEGEKAFEELHEPRGDQPTLIELIQLQRQVRELREIIDTIHNSLSGQLRTLSIAHGKLERRFREIERLLDYNREIGAGNGK